jgi:type VI secretion system secreted protein Hcp
MSVHYLLHIDGIEGESKNAQYPNHIEVKQFSWGATQSGTFATNSGGGAGKVSMQDFHFTMSVNKASVKLMKACATGEHIKSATLYALKAGKEQQTFLTVTFTDLLVSSYQAGGADGGDFLPDDSITLNFAKLQMAYKEQKADGTLGGTIQAGYDLKLNKGM